MINFSCKDFKTIRQNVGDYQDKIERKVQMSQTTNVWQIMSRFWDQTKSFQDQPFAFPPPPSLVSLYGPVVNVWVL